MKYYLRIFQYILIFGLAILLTACSSLGSEDLSNLPDSYQQIALLLPLTGSYSGPGKAVRNGFLAAYYAKLKTGQPAPTVKISHTNNGHSLNQIYAKAIKQGADLVIGPLSKKNVRALINSSSIQVPTITLNYVQNRTAPNLLFEFGISPQNEAIQVANKANSMGLSKAIVIAPKTSWSDSLLNAFENQWKNNNGTIVATLRYTPGVNLRYKIRDLLKVNKSVNRGHELENIIGKKVTFVPQRRKDFDMIFLIARPKEARQILPLLRFYYAGNVAVFSTSMIYKGVPNRNYYRDMDGVIFDDIPWVFNPNSNNLPKQKLSKLWPKTYNNYLRLYALGLDAFYLSENIKNLPSQSNNGLSANTGQLYLGPNHFILQKFVWAKFKDGKATLLR